MQSMKGHDAVRTVAAEALLQEIRSEVPLTILDVRERSQLHATGVILGARSIPQPQLAFRLEDLASARATTIVVVSQRAIHAETAVHQLQAAGFTEVVMLDGGMHRWLELGYPVEGRRLSVS
jgi:rhodanese-related sulfurtransferase